MDRQLSRQKICQKISVMKTNTLCFQRIGILIRFGKLGKTQGKPYFNSKAMGIQFPQPIFMSIFEKKMYFLAT